MNWLDVIIVIVMVGMALAGWRVGLVRSLLAAGGIVAGAALAGLIAGPLAGALTSSLESDSIASAVAYGVIAIATFLVVVVVGAILTRPLQKVALGPVNSLGGLLMGALTGFVIGGALVAFLARLAFLVPEQPLEQVRVIDTRQGVEGALLGANLVPVYLDVRERLPGGALGMMPGDFAKALDALQRAREEKG